MNDKQKGIIYIICAGFFFACMTFFVRLAGNLPTIHNEYKTNDDKNIKKKIMKEPYEG